MTEATTERIRTLVAAAMPGVAGAYPAAQRDGALQDIEVPGGPLAGQDLCREGIQRAHTICHLERAGVRNGE